MDISNRSDEQLIEQYLKGDEKSLEFLIKRYLKQIYFFVYKKTGNENEAEDITQEVFVRVWKNLKKFDSQKSFKAWIFTIAKNASIDFYKKKKAISFSEINKQNVNLFEDMLVDRKLLPSEAFDSNSISEISSKAIEKLPNEYRKILSLRYDNDLTFREIADSTGEPLNTVKSRCRRALVQLRRIIPKIIDM